MIDRRGFLGSLAGPMLARPLAAQTAGGAPEPLVEQHFPSRLHQFVWRNWEITNLDRMASVAGASQDQIGAIGRSMGLPDKPLLTGDQLSRIYITVIRQNWHLRGARRNPHTTGRNVPASLRETCGSIDSRSDHALLGNAAKRKEES